MHQNVAPIRQSIIFTITTLQQIFIYFWQRWRKKLSYKIPELFIKGVLIYIEIHNFFFLYKKDSSNRFTFAIHVSFLYIYLCIGGQSNGRRYAIWGTHGWWWIMVCHLKSVQPRTEVAERLAICWIFFLKYLATRPSSISSVSNCWSSIPMDIWHMFASRPSYFFQIHLCSRNFKSISILTSKLAYK